MEKTIEATGTPDRGQTKSVTVRRKVLTTPSTMMHAGNIMHLRNMGGNQALQRLLESGVLRAKLTVGPPNDIYEKEADEVANQVMRMPDISAIDRRSPIAEVQRKPG